MSLALTSPVVRIDVAQRVIKQIFDAALVVPGLLREIVWGVTNESRPSRPYGMFDWLSGPAHLEQLRHERANTLTESSHFLDVPASPIAGQTYVYRLNAQPHTYLVQAGDTFTDVRDAFIASINADLEPATAVAISSLRLGITANNPASIWSTSAALPLVASIDPGSTQQFAIIHQQRQTGTVSLTVYTEDAKISTGAVQIAARIGMIVDFEATVDTLANWGLAMMSIAEPVNNTQITSGGALYEGISTLDYRVSLSSIFPEPIATLDTVVGSLTVGSRVVPLNVP